MHSLLRRQLGKLALSADAPPDAAQWRAFLERVDRTYADADQDRYTLDRSLMTSSREMHALHEDLARSEANFKALVEGSPDPVFVIKDGKLLYANTAMARLLGRDVSDLTARDPLDSFVHPGDRQRVVDYRRRRDAGEAVGVLQTRWLHADGTPIVVDGAGTAIEFDGGPAMLNLCRDVTATMRVQEEREIADMSLRISEERYRVLFDRSPLSILLLDPNGLRILAANEASARLYGYERRELLAMNLADLKGADDPELAAGMTDLRRSGAAKHWYGVRKHRRKDGSIVEVEINAHPVVLDGRPVVLAIEADVGEKRQLEEQLRHAQKMDALGRFAGGIAHDFNNILAVILADAEYLLESLGEDHPLSKDARDVLAAGNRGAALTRQMLAFSRRQPCTPKKLGLNAVVTDLGKMLTRIIGEDIELATRLAPDLGCVEADPSQMDQVVLNVVVNARDAMPKGGKLTIETRNVEVGVQKAIEIGIAPGAYVMLAVADTGVGMDEATCARVFEPFFTTKAVGKGTGLGLSTVFGIVKQSNGGLSVESQSGAGTTFRVYLPRVAAARVSAAPERASAALSSAGETVLVVEDDEAVRRVVRRLLTGRGYVVVEASNGSDAIELMRTHGDAVHLVVTDVVMPGMDGRQMVERMLAQRDSIAVLYMSGYTEHPTLKGQDFEDGDHFIQKPFTAEDMAVAVKRALRESRLRREGRAASAQDPAGAGRFRSRTG
jgi:two-component system cell cycle sensor histidine kinase/response regulator CckA